MIIIILVMIIIMIIVLILNIIIMIIVILQITLFSSENYSSENNSKNNFVRIFVQFFAQLFPQTFLKEKVHWNRHGMLSFCIHSSLCKVLVTTIIVLHSQKCCQCVAKESSQPTHRFVHFRCLTVLVFPLDRCKGFDIKTMTTLISTSMDDQLFW